jgi:proline iminopeptidase
MTPDAHTNNEFFLDVGDGHQIYVHDWGNKDAKIPILFLHGGPGNGVDDGDKRKFDPQQERVIFFDQRGAGKSLPIGRLEHNQTQDIVEDIKKLADHLQITSFILTGGSWGSTLALCFGIAHPEYVAGMVLDGIFTATKQEHEWLELGQWQSMFPDVWEEYRAGVPTEHRSNPSAYYFQQARSADQAVTKKAAYEFLNMELSLLKLDDRLAVPDYEKFDPGAGLIEMHYLENKCFIAENYILDNASALTMPIHIIQGRYDAVCPPAAAYKLHQSLPNSTLTWTINGHVKQHEAKNILRIFIKQLTGQLA